MRGEIPIIVTSSPIEPGKGAMGRSWEGRGTVLDLDQRADSTNLSHELGHQAGYVGNDPIDPSHSSDSANLMFRMPFPGQTPDRPWCEKVAALFK